MVAYFFLGIVVLAVLLLLIRSVATVDAAMLARLVKGFAIAIVFIGVAYLIVAGRAGLIAAALPIGVPILLLWLRHRRSLAGAGGTWDAGTRPSGGGRSDVETAFFAMTLDHASGRLDGWIKKSKFAGRRLSELARDELLELRREVAGDPDSVSVLEAFLDRAHGPDWRGAGGGAGDQAGSSAGAASSSGAMTRDEAYEVLGLKPGAKESEIRDAHHRLMKKLHPDQGGSDYLAARVNRARDILLGT
ncbi:molecular chaperone DnaJ [Hypericibacter terrae]|uniref:Molecular chaperone DnaJ n=1 Tax=Hypericibacter terrae TaxID=2602015 RepID=A0A5J6MF42_9PROT|nr:DnaJ domain-containing protein [Hypericibacter terrae]QEX16104.1 molecular chaperone DnaJ [Hypericibacter terrae]